MHNCYYYPKNFEYGIEWLYGSSYPTYIYMQYTFSTDNFFFEKFQSNLLQQYNEDYFRLNFDLYGYHHSYIHFLFLEHNSFNSFFKDNLIDIPTCLSKTTSARKPKNEIFLSNITNYFMRRGLKTRMYKFLMASWGPLMFDYIRNTYQTPSLNVFLWHEIYFFYNFLYTQDNNDFQKVFFRFNLPNTSSTSIPLLSNHVFFSNQKSFALKYNYFNILFQNIFKFTSLFSVYIYKVDKRIYKNTRGKSGKYTFLWKYVAPYKRLNLVMYWLSKELKFRSGRTLIMRLKELFTAVMYTPQSTWVWKVKKFSTNYVYLNCRTTLAETYVTSTK